MLILTRRPGEAIYIGDDIEVTILSQRGEQTRVGITAPKEIPVHRNGSASCLVYGIKVSYIAPRTSHLSIGHTGAVQGFNRIGVFTKTAAL